MMMQHTNTSQAQSNPAAPHASEAGQEYAIERTHAAVVHALRPGTWPASPQDLTLSEADVAAVAASYAPERFKAPVVIGHPAVDDPAWGWVESAEARDDGLWLHLSLTAEMAELIRDGRYRTVSVSLWRPESAGNPSPGAWSLRHLGYLGATPPAVKGLAQTVLANETDGGTVELSAAENLLGKANFMEQEKNDQSVNLAERESALAARESALAARERELRRAVISAEVDALVGAGKVLPAEKSGLVDLMERMDGETFTLAEAAPEKQPGAVFRAFLNNLPARVTLGEVASPEKTVSVSMPKTPDGYTLSERGSDLHAAAVRLQAAHNCDYITAVRMAEAKAE